MRRFGKEKGKKRKETTAIQIPPHREGRHKLPISLHDPKWTSSDLDPSIKSTVPKIPTTALTAVAAAASAPRTNVNL